MKKTLIAIAAAATLTVASLAAPQQAEARGGHIAAGVIGGLAAGALISAAANGYYGGYYGPGPHYYGPAYAYYGGPGCYSSRQRIWTGYGWRWRSVQVCD